MTGADTEWCRRSLIDFALASYRGFEAPAHLRTLADHLQRLERGEIERLAVFMPPRHGKSTMVSQILPVWYLGRHPSHEVAICSYSANLAHKHNKAARRLAEEPASGSVFGMSLQRGGSNRQEEWEPFVGGRLAGGSCRSYGVGGSITGNGLNLGIIDDPIKNAEQALSPRYRDKIWDWYQSTLLTRQAPKAKLLLTLTRWHEDDLAGRILREEEGLWTVLSLPAILPSGQTLWPERFDRAWMDRQRRSLGSRWFGAMYDQRPPRDVSGVFQSEWFGRFGYADGHYILPSGLRVPCSVCSVRIITDLAASEKKSSDNTATLVCDETPCGHLLVLRVYAEQPGVTRIVPRLTEIVKEWYPDWIGIEADGFQQAIVNEARITPGMPPIRPLSHGHKSKLVRATPAAILAESGRILLPDSIADGNPGEEDEWIRPFLEEVSAFTGDGSGRDDRVDVLAYAVLTMVRGVSMPTLSQSRQTANKAKPKPFYGRKR